MPHGAELMEFLALQSQSPPKSGLPVAQVLLETTSVYRGHESSLASVAKKRRCCIFLPEEEW